MKNKNFLNGGYVGLIMLLISVAFIAFLIIRTDLFTGQKDGKNMIEEGNDAIQSAKDLKSTLEHNSEPLP